MTGESEVLTFHRLKEKLRAELELFEINPDAPFVLRCDASDFAIGAVLEQLHPEEQEKSSGIELGKIPLVPVGLFSRTLANSQLNGVPREKETYAIVAALRKWASHMGF